jgi:hypothetical protein
MPGLEGSVQTPFGPVKKKTGLIIVGAAVVILGVAYYRSKKASDAAAIASAGASVGVDPATGFLYGSAEDAAALANQGSYISPGGGGNGASVGGSGTIPTTGFATNGAWSQAAIQYMQSAGLVEDAAQLSAALGKYIAGSPVTDVQKSLIEQAIAFQGYPPVPGPAGYPPSVNQAPVPTTPPPTTTPPATTPPIDDGSVQGGRNVQGYFEAWNRHDPTLKLTWQRFLALNGTAKVLSNIQTWHNTNGADDAFIHDEKYRIR